MNASNSDFLSGALAMGFFVAGMHFYRFWRATGHKFFLRFCVSFWILVLERVCLTFYVADDFARSTVYTLRLVAFIIMTIAILRKGTNRIKPQLE